MGMKDQPKDKASKLEEQAKQSKQAKPSKRQMSGAKDEASERGSQPRKEDPERTPRGRDQDMTRKAMQDAEDRFNQDYDI
ncbi:hypothetical protein ABT010_20855 [Streptomyces sp. NPDC002668]|uniref:hypothetical protein n=1 Tax=Streptomyces sp. NPDC002668 TaxID=3154422 RepID=UPI0033217F02